jgi:hypothetical protein
LGQYAFKKKALPVFFHWSAHSPYVLLEQRFSIEHRYSNIAPPCAACTFCLVVYHIECASNYYNTKNQVLKKAETEHISLLGQASFSRFDFVWLFANFGSSQKKTI